MKELILNNLFGLGATLTVSFFIYFLQERKARSADRERIKQTKKEIIDTIEAYIINNQDISESVIINFKIGIERANEVIIENEWDSIALLQDISFRLQSSRHLAVDQKLEYANKLDILIKNWSSEKNLNLSVFNNRESKIVGDILNLINSDKKDEAKNQISKLLSVRRFNIINQGHDEDKKLEFIKRISTSLAIGLLISSVIIAMSKRYFEKVPKNQVDMLDRFLFVTPEVAPYFYGFMLLAILIFLTIYFRGMYLKWKDRF